ILNAGGSYITLDPCKIELGTSGDFTIKAADFDYRGPAKMDASHPEYPPLQEDAKQSLYFSIPQAPNREGISWEGMPYTLYADGAVVKKGVLDSSGKVTFEHQVVTQAYKLEMASGVSYKIPIVEAYRNAGQGKLANRGFHNHSSQINADITSTASHTTHRNSYSGLIDGPDDMEEA
ncbi:DUF2345 domain-containing protein, partial [Enterobacteriaceae bacterium LUAb1]